MQRTSREPVSTKVDYSPLLRAIMYLDEVLKRGVVIGVYEDSREVSDEDIKRALTNVNSLLAGTRDEIDKLARSLARAQAPGSTLLQ
jgi:hypothetical protein